jgi:exodeoxyribonuclease-3
MSLTIATWNVNSVRMRLPHLTDWLRATKTDIMLLQELKCQTDAFPYQEIEDCGYNIAVNGQKTYNGVAILSRYPLNDVSTILPEYHNPDEARYIEAVVDGPDNFVCRVVSIYVPNGQEPGSPAFADKLTFLENVRDHAGHLAQYDEAVVLGGDFNVAPEPIDVYDAHALDGTTCFHPSERERLRTLLYDGWYDAYRTMNPKGRAYSWWDYRAGAWQQNKGMRIDHLLLSPQAADRLTACNVDLAPRTLEKASDHTPVVATLRTV